MLKRPIGFAAVLFAIGVVAGVYFAPTQLPTATAEEPKTKDASKDEPQNTKKDSAKDTDSFGFTSAFDAELKKLGQISPQQFAERYPAPKYAGKLSFDPTTAKFFAEMNVEKTKKSIIYVREDNGKEIKSDPVEIPGYKLTAVELAKFKVNGFIVTERLGGKSFGQVYYDIYHRDLPVFITSDSVLHAWHRSSRYRATYRFV